MSELVRISLSLEDSLLDKLTEMVNESGYENRSEYIRDLIRDRIISEQWESGHEVVASVTLVYNHHQRGLTEKLVELQHHCGEQVLASTHLHLSHEICLEVIMIKGKGDNIRSLVNSIRQLRGVLNVDISMSTTGEHIS
jgi:CopG family nickel-responsive transcriptional regulator